MRAEGIVDPRRARLQVLAGVGALAVVMLTPASALAEDQWSQTVEIEHERVTYPEPALWSDSLASITSFRHGPSQFDFKLEAGRDESYGQSVGGRVELRYRLHLPTVLGVRSSVRVSVGEAIGAGPSGVFPFFTIQPKIAYAFPSGWAPYVSARYRDAFESERYFRTVTWYGGVAIPLPLSWQIEPSYFHKSGDERSNGMKLEISHAF